ncbi:hypothetical protein [Streptomyces sp. NPDC007074]|uniref:hypothetical protein n=1 Tax=Streptomyces sp. NPDC007074 TaxID=3156764 RepID=UPI0033D2C8FE
MTDTASTWDDLEKRLDSVRKPVQTFKLCEDASVRDRYNQARYANERAQQEVKDLPKDTDADARAIYVQQAKEAAAEFTAAKRAYDANVIVLRFAALERRHLERLQNEHPPTEADESEGRTYAMNTFAPAVISAASLDGMPVAAAQRYLDTWHAADAADLWRAAWSIQHQERTDLGKD